jgi:hypothetical protein
VCDFGRQVGASDGAGNRCDAIAKDRGVGLQIVGRRLPEPLAAAVRLVVKTAATSQVRRGLASSIRQWRTTTMPIFIPYDGIDGDVTSRPGQDGGTYTPPLGWRYSNLRVFEPASSAGSGTFAQGETLVHIEASIDDSHADLIFGGDDSTADVSNVEVLVKVLNGPHVNAQGETLVHVESASWLLA